MNYRETKGDWMLFDRKQRNVYLASAVIIGSLFFMLGNSLYISHNISGGSSLEIAIDQRIDQCYKEKGLD